MAERVPLTTEARRFRLNVCDGCGHAETEPTGSGCMSDTGTWVDVVAVEDVRAVLGELVGEFEDAFSTGDDAHGDLKASALYLAATRLGLDTDDRPMADERKDG